jgi:hypothetical protein
MSLSMSASREPTKVSDLGSVSQKQLITSAESEVQNDEMAQRSRNGRVCQEAARP